MLARAQLAVGALLTALIASGCAAPSSPVPAPIRFEISDLSKPEGLAPVVAQSGAVFHVPVQFRIEVRVVGTGSSGADRLRVNTTSYTAECNGVPIPESYRTKQIVLPPGLTTEPNSTAWSNAGHCRPSSSPLPLNAWTRRSRGHAFPDGAVLYLGTMCAPIDDRDAPGKGFTHKTDDIVTIASPMLGRLVNRIRPTDQCARWDFGAGSLMRNLAQRDLL
jgi:hypothetical protein